MTGDDQIRHDFKSHAIIRGFAEILLSDTAASEPRRGDLEEIHKAVVTALDLVARVSPSHANTAP